MFVICSAIAKKCTVLSLNIGFDWNHLIGFYILYRIIGLGFNIGFDIDLIVFFIRYTPKNLPDNSFLLLQVYTLFDFTIFN